MKNKQLELASINPIWTNILLEAEAITKNQSRMSSFIYSSVLSHRNIESVISYRLAQKLSTSDMTESVLYEAAIDSFNSSKNLKEFAYSDLVAVKERDPACSRYIEPLLYFKGFQALQAYRISNFLYNNDNVDLALFFQMRSSEIFSVDIHPAASIGRGIMIDHAHSIVIGETATVGNNVSILHSVTLGGTGKEKGDRHPHIGEGVLLGAGCSILGNIKVGRCSRVASGSVVLSDVPECKTVAGVPAKIVGEAGCDQPSNLMNHQLE